MAELYKWNDSYSVGIDAIDDQHRKWLSLINDLHSALKDGTGKVAVNGILAGIVDYTVTHFTYEQKELVRCGYPDYQRHLQIHEAFTANIRKIQQDAGTNSVGISLKVMETVREWLINHINKEDKLYAPYLKQKAA